MARPDRRGTAAGSPTWSVEKVDGVYLTEALPESALRRLAIASMTGLAGLHREGVAHGSFTPWSVILTGAGTEAGPYSILDALVAEGSPSVSETRGHLVGRRSRHDRRGRQGRPGRTSPGPTCSTRPARSGRSPTCRPRCYAPSPPRPRRPATCSPGPPSRSSPPPAARRSSATPRRDDQRHPARRPRPRRPARGSDRGRRGLSAKDPGQRPTAQEALERLIGEAQLTVDRATLEAVNRRGGHRPRGGGARAPRPP